MEIISSIQEMKARSLDALKKGISIGFAPTMGYLHEGHLSLFKKCRAENDLVIASIFVNPIQFGPQEDLVKYPKDLEGDKKKLASEGVDILFLPSQDDLYPKDFKTVVNIGEISEKLCGQSRPTLFKGAATVVLKLLNIVQPQKAYFGEKDWQQLAVIEALVEDLNLDIALIRVPIVREADGLAMSSRNCYLSPQDRITALSLSRSLKQAVDVIRQGTTSSKVISHLIQQCLLEKGGLEIDYISICDPKSFKEKEQICGRTLIALAVKIGESRLIDNCVIEEF